ncbi:MAG TPA: tail fiber domain-containing protein [Thermomicrobiales bacterium]|nr:tail fiber domain-containing protein [Thermomicrobiales bacterium]
MGSRRAAIGLLGGGALAAALPAVETRAGDLCALKGGRCKNGGDCCSGRCHRRKGKTHGKCRCSRTQGTECVSGADCCAKQNLACVVGVCELPPSDRARKRDVASVDPADMLARVAALPIASWSYTFDDPAVRHIGPMAQDFAALFDVGADDRHIHPIDGQGAALAAIQGLYAEVRRLQAEQTALRARLLELEAERA